tara:strand:+ start:9736 stop:10929 length:1194 start_codon:yes stop_codon:yes gene_type:complete
MLGKTFGHNTIRDYVVAFGTIFNDISIIRRNPDRTVESSPVGSLVSNPDKYVRVPLAYAPQERFLARLNQDPTISKSVAITLPRMSFEMTTMNYAGERKLGTTQRLVQAGSGEWNTVSSVYAPVPYDFGFSLHLYTRNTNDATSVVEQILPFFTPEFTLSIKSMTDVGIKVDVPIILNGISKDDNYEGSFDERRTLIWTLDFTLKGQLFGPVDSKSSLIKKAYIDFFIPSSYSILTGNALSINTNGQMYNFGNNQIRLAANSSSIWHYYRGANLEITAGASKGDQVKVISYNGTTKVANVAPNFTYLPNTTSQYSMQYYIPGEHDDGSIQTGGSQAATTASRVTLEPGLTANGLPTSNSNLSISVDFINANDDYGIIKTVTFLDAGTRRNLTTGVDE